MLIDWLIPNCKLCGRPDAHRIAQTLMDYSYIIPVDQDFKFKEAQIYIFQTSFLWPTVPWQNLGQDYFIFLIKRTQRKEKGQQLTVVEEQRLERLMVKFKKTRDEIAKAVKAQAEFTETLNKNDKKIFLLQEHAFWKYQRPLLQTANTPSPTMKDDSTMRVRTFEEYLTQLSDDKILAYVEKKVAQLQAANHMKRSVVSMASKTIIDHTVLFQIVDPFVEANASNPFVCDDTKLWDSAKTTPTPADLKLWRHHITNLLADPLGVSFFHTYLFSQDDSTAPLDLHLRIRALDTISSYTDYVTESIHIFNEFIPLGSPREVTLTFGIRSRLVANFTILQSQMQFLESLDAPTAAASTAFPTISLFNGAGTGTLSTANLAAISAPPPPAPTTGGTSPMPTRSKLPTSVNNLNSSMGTLQRMTEGGSRTPAVLANQYHELQSRKKTIGAGTGGGYNAAGDVTTSAALEPERLVGWRLAHDIFSGADQHLVVSMQRDSFAEFWASSEMRELVEKVL
ncbi:Regulator of G-protein signaling 7 [Podochytrium sp. JEL0797]|nr:Regulator of G-protein signaling 7 [Podochytrium sp. JEL0797]